MPLNNGPVLRGGRNSAYAYSIIGLRIADCGLRIADYGLRITDYAGRAFDCLGQTEANLYRTKPRAHGPHSRSFVGGRPRICQPQIRPCHAFRRFQVRCASAAVLCGYSRASSEGAGFSIVPRLEDVAEDVAVRVVLCALFVWYTVRILIILHSYS